MAVSTPKSSVPLFIKYWFPVVLYAIVIFYISSIPGKQIPAVFKYQDMVFHILEYGGFAFFISRAAKAQFPAWVFQRRFILVVAVAVLYALSDEFHQSFVPDRYATLSDVAVDSFGALLAAIFYR